MAPGLGPGPYARKLACDLINEQFGELVQKVCDCLVNRGQLLLPEIARFTGIGLPQLRNCLLVLIQHNCVQAFKVEQEGAFGAPAKQNTFYIAILDNILHRTRFPKFLMVVHDELGKEAEGLMSGLLQHGRLTLEQLVKRAAECAQASESEVDMILKETFVALVRSHYIERCPVSEPTLGFKNKDDQPRKKSRTAMKGRTPVVAETEEQRVLAASALMEGERFRVPASLEGLALDKDAEDIVPAQPSVGQKRTREALEMDASTMAAVDAKEVVWRVNYEECLRRLRHQACIKLVRSKIDLGAGTILSCMLDATRKSERLVKERISDALTMDVITQAVRTTAEGRTMTMERIRAALLQMTNDGFVNRVGDAGSQYVINMQRIMELARQNEIEGIVLQRFGRKSCRIFRLLNMKGHLEHKQISDRSLVPLKETWELLYKLVKQQYIELQEVPKSTDRAPSRTFYVWRVNLNNVSYKVLNDMYHAACNLGKRLSHELEQEQELLSLSKRSTGVVLTSAQQEQANRLSNIAKVLETSLLKLDDAIMLFHDF